MKKLLTIAALAGVASMSYGQGYVEWNSSGLKTSVNTTNYGVTGGTVSTMPANTTTPYYFALFVAPSTDLTAITPTNDPTAAGFTFTGIYGTNTTKGNIAGETTYSDGLGIQVPGYGVGATANFVIVGWSSLIGSTWQAAEPYLDGTGASVVAGDYVGTSTVFDGAVLAAAGSSYQNIMGSSPAIGGFTLYQAVQVPEPATFALCGLGAAALVIFRRRN